MTDAQWARVEPLLPDRTPKRGGRRRDHRQVIDAIAFKYRTGTPWTDLPERFGSWMGAHNRLRRWAADGTWEKVFTALLAEADAEGDLEWVVAVDSTIVRAHQHAAGARPPPPLGRQSRGADRGRLAGGLRRAVGVDRFRAPAEGTAGSRP
uniref:IS5 family transposase n=1 Tax=Streptomyces hygroscopicus TaxID=1912 RepID=A0A1X9PPU2_STRHY|nr:IS5 family transposase [Streptomyces hygroscopicus]